MTKIAIVDIETSGLDPETHEILEIGVVIFDTRTLEIVNTLDLRVKPEHIETANPQALKVNGYNEEEWTDCMSLQMAMMIFKAQTQDATFCAHNMIFDWSFILKASEKTGVGLNFDYHKLDLLSIAWARIPHNKVQSWSLKTICSYLNITPEPKLHRGLQGAMKEYEVYKSLMSI
jgi:DNA polymerase-3 subunit epsilon